MSGQKNMAELNDTNREARLGKMSFKKKTNGARKNPSKILPHSREDVKKSQAKYTVWKVPPADVIKAVLQCNVCGNVGKSFRQCNSGHLLCGRGHDDEVAREYAILYGDGYKFPEPEPECKNNKLKTCPVSVVTKKGKTVPCGQIVFDGKLELYSLLYDGCTMNCPASDIGCEEKMKSKDLVAHMKECSFTIKKKCPNSSCEHEVRLHDFIKHIHTRHGVQRYEGARNLVKVYQDSLKLELSPFQWVAAVLVHEGNTFLLMVRHEDQFVVIWLTHVQPANPKPKFISKITVQKPDGSTSAEAKESWTGAVDASPDWPYKTETQEAFKLHIARLLRYKMNEPELQRYCWDVTVDLQPMA